MSQIFLSHSSKDNVQAKKLAQWLKDNKHRSLFLDFDPADGIPAGHDWEKEIYRKLQQCQAMIVLCSEHSMQSQWCFAEVMFARAEGKHIFPIRLDQSDIWSHLNRLQIIDFTTDPDDGLLRLERALKLKGLNPAEVAEWDNTRPPYPGLPAFQEKDAAIFFGRDEEIHHVIADLNQARQLSDNQMLMLEGASGSGKSSLLRAGVIPRLRIDTTNWIVINPFRPMKNALHELTSVLNTAFSQYTADPSQQAGFDEIIRAIREHRDADGLLNTAINFIQTVSGHEEAMPLLIIDQFEELLGTDINEQSGFLIDLLINSFSVPDKTFLLIATMRSDFHSEFLKHPELKDIAFQVHTVMPMKNESYEQVITGPAMMADLRLEPGLVQCILDDIESEHALPLLAFTLRELWERYADDHLLTIEEYKDKLGGLHNSVAKVAESLLQTQKASPENIKIFRDFFISLARINEEGQFVRKSLLWDDIPERNHPLITEFVNKHLLVSRVDEQNSQRMIEVAHESLFRTWKRLKQWLDEERGFLEWRHRLQTEIHDWQHVDQDKGSLLRGTTLSDALGWIEKKPGLLTENEMSFIQTSSRHRSRLRKLFTTLAAGTVFTLLVSAVIAFVQRDHALDARDNARSRLVTNYWMNAIDERDDRKNTLKASHYFIQAAQLDRENNGQLSAVASLAGQFLNGDLQLDAILEEKSKIPEWFRALSPCPDSAAKLATHYGKGQITLPNNQGTIKHKLVRCAIYSENRQKILSWSDENDVRVWNAEGVQLLRLMHKDNVRGAIFNRDLTRILSWSDDHSAILWDATNGQRLSVELLHDNPVIAASFSPDETSIATRDKKNQVRIWKRKKTPPLTLFYPDQNDINHDGNDNLVPHCSFEEGIATIHDPMKWRQPRQFNQANAVKGCYYHPTKSYLLTWNATFELKIWRVDNETVQFQKQFTSLLNGASLSADGKTIQVWNSDGRIEIWELSSQALLAEIQDENQITGATLNPAQDRVLSWDNKGNIKLRALKTKQEIFPPQQHKDMIQAIYSPDERYIATWNYHRLILWDSQQGYALTPPLRHTAAILDVQFNAEVDQITVTMSNGIRIWNLPVNAGSAIAQEVATGTVLLHETGELLVLNEVDWLSRKANMADE